MGVLARLFVIALVVGCAGKKYYVVDYELSSRTVESEQTQFPRAEALRLLSRARIVAFAPPDECAISGGTRDLARQRCGEVVSSLEELAAEAGFEVVSWQALKGSEPPLTYARRNKADVLFEINRLGAEDSADVHSAGELRFSTMDDKGTISPLAVGPGLQKRCRDLLLGGVAGDVQVASVMLDIKMVSVRDGVTLWRFRRLVSPALLTREARRLHFQARRSKSPPRIAALAGGAVGLSTGATFLMLAALADDDFAAAGVLGAAAGGGLLALGLSGRESPEVALCARSPDRDPFAAPLVETVPADGSQTSFETTFSSGANESDLLRIVSRIGATDFVELLVFLRTLAPTPPRLTMRPPRRPARVKDLPSGNCDDYTRWFRENKLSRDRFEKTGCKLGSRPPT